MLALPRSTSDVFRTTPLESSQLNKGLLFDRYFDRYDQSFAVDSKADSKELQRFVGLAGNSVAIEKAVLRQTSLVNALNGKLAVFNTDWHFVTGMGNSHPVENGFTWHQTLGTPYIPGSSVKGILRAWMEYSGEATEDLISSWFGDGSDKNQGKAGSLIFFDALPRIQPHLGIDIMTPHSGNWYANGASGSMKASDIPGDWHTPVPISFLVTKQASFVFSIAPRFFQAQFLAVEAVEHLKSALAWLGAGAKTGAGYGHMSFDEETTTRLIRDFELDFKEAQRAEQLSNLDPIDLELLNLSETFEDEKAKNQSQAGSQSRSILRELILKAETDSWSKDKVEKLLLIAQEMIAVQGGNKKKAKELIESIKKLVE